MAVGAPTPEEKSQDVNVPRASLRAELADLFAPRASRYWLDFLLSAVLGWTFFLLALSQPFTSIWYWVCVSVSVFALYRAVSFTHELAHLRKSAVPGFRTGWTLLCGLPLLVPNFLYTGVHIAHHGKRTYGTQRDGEYLPFATSPPSLIAQHLMGNLILPVFAVARFALIGPVSFLHRRLRAWVVVNLSGMSLRFPFRRDPPARVEDHMLWLKEELATSVFIIAVIGAVVVGWLPGMLLVQYGLVVFMIATLNSVRAVGATHRYRSVGEEYSLQRQFEDSVNVDSNRLDTLLLCPVGLRYHALHHAFPTLPYHALAEGHRRLLRVLPAGAPYHATIIGSVWQGWKELLEASARHRREGSQAAPEASIQPPARS